MTRKRSSSTLCALPAAALAFLAPAPAGANDTMAVQGAGGLELTTSQDVVMVSEDLYLSPGEIRVRYAFRNTADRDIVARVAFPLPEISQSEIANIDLPASDPQNFVDFRVTADGQALHPQMEQKALAEDKTDVTSVLAEAGLPANARQPDWAEKVRALPDDAWRKLVARGLFDIGEQKSATRTNEVSPTWSLKTTFHWEQTFPAGKTILVDHRYKPIAGGAIVYPGDKVEEAYGDYCLDQQGEAGLHHLLKQSQAAAQADPQKSAGVAAIAVDYVLTTGANWKGPIGSFHLTIDKEDPAGILSLCMSGLKKTGPTTFELEQANFTPKEDIRFVVFKPSH